MKKLSPEELKNIEFSDCEVNEFALTPGLLRFSCSGAFLGTRGFIDAQVDVTICDWSQASVERFNSQGTAKETLDPIASGSLREICKCIFDRNVTLEGFEKESGRWQTYTFISPKVDISIN